MKKLLLPVLLLATVIANAQFKAGDKYLGGYGSLSLGSSSAVQNTPNNNSSNGYVNINLGPQFLKATNYNTLKGIYTGLGFSTYQTKQDNSGNYRNTQFVAGFGYLIRKYKPLSEKIFWYMQYDAEVVYYHQWQNYNDVGLNQNGWGSYLEVEVLPALAFKPNERLLVDINFGGVDIGYQHSKDKLGHGNNYFLQASFSNRISLGMFWKINKHKS